MKGCMYLGEKLSMWMGVGRGGGRQVMVMFVVIWICRKDLWEQDAHNALLNLSITSSS